MLERNKFLSIRWFELLSYLFSGTILSQILRIILLQSNKYVLETIRQWGIGETNSFLSVYCISALVAAIVVVIILKKKGITLEDLGFNGKVTLKMTIVCIFCVVSGVFLYSIIDWIVRQLGFGMYWGDSSRSYSVIPQTAWDIVLLVVSTMIFTPLAEDTIFRGVLINFLNARYKKINSIVLASIIFALIHVPFYGPGLTIYMFFWTMISAMLFYKYKSLYPCMIFHTLNNMLAYIVFPVIF